MTLRDGPHAETRRMMETAIRRLNALEYVILAFAMALSLSAGALTAWILQNSTGVPFRISWVVASLLFFGVPGFLVLRRERRAEARSAQDRVSGSALGRDQDPVPDFTAERDDG